MIPIIPITLTTAGILGIIFVVLSLRVSQVRNKVKDMDGTGDGAAILHIAVRSHGNFAEFVPLALILMGGDELCGGSHLLLRILAIVLIAARLAHPVGLARPAPNLFRALGAGGTYLIILLASIDALILAL